MSWATGHSSFLPYLLEIVGQRGWVLILDPSSNGLDTNSFLNTQYFGASGRSIKNKIATAHRKDIDVICTSYLWGQRELKSLGKGSVGNKQQVLGYSHASPFLGRSLIKLPGRPSARQCKSNHV